ncbi:MAG: MMPL family transporter [Gammaproteobacteria bacterium]|nr:MMPL family transporter [Gammaproteobacteria bacterium]
MQALMLAVIGIALILAVALRSVRDALLVLAPLTLAAVFTVAVAVLIDMPFNMANVLVLPLIFGLGVDNGIHVVDRFRRERDVSHLMHSSTPRAVLLSTLTTVGAFAALMLSPHQGTASIGALLTIAIVWLLLFTVLVLPMLLSVVRPQEPTTEHRQ